MDFQDFGNGFLSFGNAFSIFGNGFLIFGNAFQRFWKWIFNLVTFQCISLNLFNEFLIKKLHTFNNFYIFIKNSWLFYGFCIELLPQNIDD